jgi:Domain of unknown function (DUF4186)
MDPDVDELLDRMARHPFRATFHLRDRDRATAELRGVDTMRAHAAELIADRLAPAEPRRDGRQTPYRGHPVFVAQHATATCCRTCLLRWHEIPTGRPLTREERSYVVGLIGRWIERELAAGQPPPVGQEPRSRRKKTSHSRMADGTS